MKRWVRMKDIGKVAESGVILADGLGGGFMFDKQGLLDVAKREPDRYIVKELPSGEVELWMVLDKFVKDKIVFTRQGYSVGFEAKKKKRKPKIVDPEVGY